MEYLEKLIEFFESKGEAYVVRMPVSKEMREIERKYMPDFGRKMNNVARSAGAEYVSFFQKSGAYSTTDGNHLWRKDARRFSRDLAREIKCARSARSGCKRKYADGL